MVEGQMTTTSQVAKASTSGSAVGKSCTDTVLSKFSQTK